MGLLRMRFAFIPFCERPEIMNKFLKRLICLHLYIYFLAFASLRLRIERIKDIALWREHVCNVLPSSYGMTGWA